MENPVEKLARIRNELQQAESEETNNNIEDIGYSNGDLFDEDSGEYLGEIDVKDAHNGKEIDTLPAGISVFFNGYFYIFAIKGRYKAEENENAKN
mgnify:FL=1